MKIKSTSMLETPSGLKTLQGHPLLRIAAELRTREGNVVSLSQEVMQARLVLYDFHSTSISLFTERPTKLGTEISLTIQPPLKFSCFGRVKSCGLTANASKIIAAVKFEYRTSIEIVFQSEEEADSVRKFVKQLRIAS